MILNTVTALSQSKVYGTVLSKHGHIPVWGVTVIAKESKVATQTDSLGRFVLKLKSTDTTITVSAIAFQETEIKLNGKDTITIFLKEICNRDWFDNQRIGFGLVSGIFHEPFGAAMSLSFPAFYKQTTLKASYSYQTNFKHNQLSNASLSLLHIAPSCNFVADAKAAYQKLHYANSINSEAYTIQAYLNVRGVKYIAGIGKINYSNIPKQENVSSFGPILGIGTWIPRHESIYVGAQISIYKNLAEYSFDINKEFESFKAFIGFNKINNFSELSIGIGKTFTYKFKNQL